MNPEHEKMLRARKQVAAIVKKNPSYQAELDEMIVDAHNEIASNINNSGIEAQLEWLQEVRMEDIRKLFN